MQGRNETFVVVDKKGNQATSGLFNSKPRPNSTPSPSSNNATAQNNTSSNIPTIDRQELPRFDDDPFPRPTLSKLEEIKEREEPKVIPREVPVFKAGQEYKSRSGVFGSGDDKPQSGFNDLRDIAHNLKRDQYLSVIIKGETNLSWFLAGRASEIGGNLEGLLNLRAEAIRKTLIEMGLKKAR